MDRHVADLVYLKAFQMVRVGVGVLGPLFGVHALIFACLTETPRIHEVCDISTYQTPTYESSVTAREDCWTGQGACCWPAPGCHSENLR